MSTYLSNRDSSGKTNEEGHYRLYSRLLDGHVSSGMNIVTSVTPDMNVRITAGEIRIPYQNYSYNAWNDDFAVVLISTADTTNPRIDRIVAYIDRTMTFTSGQVNNPGALKFKSVIGTPSATPTAALDAAVQSSVGTGNPWVELGKINLPALTSVINTDNIFETFLNVNVAPQYSMFPGSIIDFAGTAAPSGWLLCYGQLVSRLKYSGLFATIGTSYGIGDGSTTFSIPDLRGRVVAGKDNMGGVSSNRLINRIGGTTLGAVGGFEEITMTIAEMPVHSHGQQVSANAGSNPGRKDFAGEGPFQGGYPQGLNTFNEGGGTSHNNTQPTIILNKIIKY